MDCNGMSELRRSGFNNHVVQQSPRVGGCTGAFFNLFDWNNTKRLASTKRLPAERPEKPLGRSKSFRDDRSRVCSPSLRKAVSHEKTDDCEVISNDDASSRPPVGLVARLMGLESLPEATARSKHRRPQSFSGSESVYYVSERDSRPGERLPLRDMLKQDHDEQFEASWNDEILVVPNMEYENRQRCVRKGDVETPPMKTGYSLVPYVDSPCRSVYALSYKGEKSPFLARLHPSPVLQPSKCHNQMVTPTSPGAEVKKRASRFLEAAVKILEEISDNEEGFPSEREGMRSIAEFAAASSPAGTDLLHCRSVSRVRNGGDGAESVGSWSNRSLMSRGSVSFRDSQRRDRICRDIFEGSLSERAPSVSPPPRRDISKGRRILRTQEAAVGDFKTDVRKASPGRRKNNSTIKANSKCLQQTATPVREKAKSLHFQVTRISNDLEDHYDAFTSDEESPLASVAVRRKFKKLVNEHRSSLKKSPSKGVMSSPDGDFRTARDSRARVVLHEVPSPQLRTRPAPGSLHAGVQRTQLSRNRQQEDGLSVSSKRVQSTELAKSRSAASSPNHSRRQKDDLKLAGHSKKSDASSKQEKQGRAAATESPPLPCRSPLPTGAPLKRSRRKARHGSPKLRESSGHSRSLMKTPPRSNLHEESSPDKHNLEAKSPARIPTGEKDADSIFSNVLPDIAQPASRDEVNMIDVNADHSRDETFHETGEVLRHEKVERIIERDLLPASEMAQCNNESLVLGMEDLHWDADAVVQRQTGDISCRARYCEIRASGESLRSNYGAFDEDICNVDDGSSPSPQKFAGECSEADGGESSTPVLMKFFLGKPLRLDVDMGETSPVSVLESPFGDEACTTSESSIPESDRQATSFQEHTETATSFTEPPVAECEIEQEQEQEEVSTPTPLDRIRQAILDISSFTIRDPVSDYSTQGSPQTEKTFVREVLSAAQLLCSPGRSPNWYERDLAVDPTLFERLEGVEGDFRCESGGMWRCDRKLLFDCVNEAFSQNTRHFKDPQPWLRRAPVLRLRAVRQKVVEEVHEKINGWRELASHAIDTLIDFDMSSKEGKWTEFSEDVSEIGAQIEGMVWQVMVEEIVLELANEFLDC